MMAWPYNGVRPLLLGDIMEGEYVFFQLAAGLPAGLSLADYKHRFYGSSSPLNASITNPQDGDVLVFDDGVWKNVNFNNQG
jgi:hypothetical protein